MFFQKVPERKTVKNRLHLDVKLARDVEDPEQRWAAVLAHVERLIQAGATQLGEHRGDFGEHWIVLADPEGNEFCVS